jgi:hypothetical protein
MASRAVSLSFSKTAAQRQTKLLTTRPPRTSAISPCSTAELKHFLTVETLPQLTVNDVPPGTYDVRVRALDEIGHSGTSKEVIVTVQ